MPWDEFQLQRLRDADAPADSCADGDLIVWDDLLSQWKNVTLASIADSRYYTEAEIDALLVTFLKLDQSTPQTVVNGKPTFNEGLVIPASMKIYFDG